VDEKSSAAAAFGGGVQAWWNGESLKYFLPWWPSRKEFIKF
jgi:hypothetical protein